MSDDVLSQEPAEAVLNGFVTALEDVHGARSTRWSEEVRRYREELERRLAENEALREALEDALDRMEEMQAVFASDEYRAVFTSAAVHGVRYEGPQVDAEALEESVSAARELLEAHREGGGDG